MHNGEGLVRRLLHDAAEDVRQDNLEVSPSELPTMLSARTNRRQVPKRGKGLPALTIMRSVAVAAIFGVVGLGWVAAQAPDAPGDFGCPSSLTWANRTYVGFSDVRRLPHPDDSLGLGASPECDDGNGIAPAHVYPVSSIKSVNPKVALLAQGKVWLREGVTDREFRQVEDFKKELPCEEVDHPVEGALLAVTGTARGDGRTSIAPPYTAVMSLQTAPDFWAEYAEVTIRVAITAKTTGGSDGVAIRRALDGQRVSLSFVCNNSQFRAEKLQLLADQHSAPK